MKAVHEAGANAAGYTMLRLPWTVAPVFLEWLQRTQPQRADRVEERVRSTREGKLNDSTFGSRMRGTGVLAEQIRNLFKLFAKRYGLDGDLPAYDRSHFRRPADKSGQLSLF